MSDAFDTLNDYMPRCLVILLGLTVLPGRVALIALLPLNSWMRWHPLYNVQKFLKFR